MKWLSNFIKENITESNDYKRTRQYNKLTPKMKRAVDMVFRAADKDADVIANFEDLTSNDRQIQVAEEIKRKIVELFESKEVDEVSILFNKFVSAIAQEPSYQSLIPMASDDEQTEEVVETSNAVFEFEPDKNELLEYLLPRNFLTQIYRSVLESSASEHAARMTSMDNATRNAGDMIDRLTLTYNRTRQAFITKELIEIISGAEAV